MIIGEQVSWIVVEVRNADHRNPSVVETPPHITEKIDRVGNVLQYANQYDQVEALFSEWTGIKIAGVDSRLWPSPLQHPKRGSARLDRCDVPTRKRRGESIQKQTLAGPNLKQTSVRMERDTIPKEVHHFVIDASPSATRVIHELCVDRLVEQCVNLSIELGLSAPYARGIHHRTAALAEYVVHPGIDRLRIARYALVVTRQRDKNIRVADWTDIQHDVRP